MRQSQGIEEGQASESTYKASPQSEINIPQQTEEYPQKGYWYNGQQAPFPVL